MDAKMVSLELNADVVKPIIQKQIAVAIADGLGGADAVVEAMIKAALSTKVSHDGNKSRYSSENKYDFVEAIVGKEIRGAAKDALKEWVKENAEKIKGAIIKEMMKPSVHRKLAAAFAEAATKSIGCSWKPNIEIRFEAPEK